MSSVRASALFLGTLLVGHTLLLGWAAWCHGPGADEPAHLASGVVHWRLKRWEPYRVNPPLVRMVATVPLMWTGIDVARPSFDARPGSRPEFTLGMQMMTAEGSRFLWLLIVARWACIPFSLCGLIICYRWAAELYGQTAGLAAATMWTFSPNILAHAQMITPDAGATAIGLAACYAFDRWWKSPTWSSATLSGVLLSLSWLSKTTWLVLLPVWGVLAVVRVWQPGHRFGRGRRASSVLQATWMLLVALILLNAGYRFTGTGTLLGRYEFVSGMLSSIEVDREDPRGDPPEKTGNRFRGTWLEYLPIPFPRDFVQGIDEQKRDFESVMSAYLAGELREGGWWYYYLFAALVKIPVGTWLLVVMALGVSIMSLVKGNVSSDTVVLLTVPTALLILVSSQTGINQHARYALPALPFLFIAGSGAMRCHGLGGLRWRRTLAWLFVFGSAIESLSIYPHSLSFFNVAVGGPNQGYRLLGVPSSDSALDWGLDVTYLKEWCDRHPEARPLYADIDTIMPLAVLGIDAEKTPMQPVRGWYAVSIGKLVRDRRYTFLTTKVPVDQLGYTIYIYHVQDFRQTGKPDLR